MIKRFLSKIFSDQALFDILPSALINNDGIILGSNDIFKQHISPQINVGLKDILSIKTVDNQIFGSVNGRNWMLVYKYYSSKECKVWAVPEMSFQPSVWSILPNPLLLIRDNGRIEYVNESFMKAFPNYEAHDFVPKFCFAFDEKMLIDGKSYEIIWGDSLCRLKVYSYGPNIWLLYLENMNDLHLIDSKLKESNYLCAMGQITSSVVHDFRNILSVINGYCELIIDGCDRYTTQNYIKQINNTVSNASNMVNELLKFSRTKNVLEDVSCSPRQVLENLRQIIDKIVGPMIGLKFNLKESSAKVGISEIDLERIITNIVMNARDSIESEGTIEITLAKKYFGKGWTVNNCHIRSGFYVLINIDDTGHGINLADQAKIFSPFFTTKRNGNGLGLSTIMSILREIGGGVSLMSSATRGTRISIYMPIVQSISKNTPKIALEELKIQSKAIPNQNIVMVEDNPDVLNICSLVLSKEGYNLQKYVSAEEAMDVINSTDTIDLLITDVNLPGMSGAELVDALHKSGKNIKSILVISGYDESVLEKKFPPKTNFLSKPIPLSELKKKVHTVLKENAG
jgi:signal transduction histidine kinase